MKRNWLKTFLVFTVLVAGLLLGTFYGILHTTAGARLLVYVVENQLGESLELGEISGSVGAGLDIDTIDFRNVNLAIRANKTRLAVKLTVFPITFKIRFLEISSLQIRQENPPAKSTGMADTQEIEEILASLALPFPVILSRLELDGIEYFDHSGALVFSAEHISSAVHLHNVLDISHLALEAKQTKIALDGRIGLSPPFPVALNARAKQAPYSENGQAGDGLFVESLVLSGQGMINDYELEINSILHLPGMEQISLDLRGNGNDSRMVVTALHLAGRQLEMTAEGEIQWRDEIAIRLDAGLARFDPSAWLPGWPEENPLQGQLIISLGADGLELPKMHFLVSDTTTRLDATATIDLEQGVLEADLAWSDITWPIAGEKSEILSQTGEVHLSGSPDDWALSGDTTIQTAGFPPGQLSLEAHGNRESAVMNIINGRVLGGELTGELEFGWTGAAHWTAILDARAIRTGILLPAWPGSINTRLKADGSLEPFRLNLDILQPVVAHLAS